MGGLLAQRWRAHGDRDVGRDDNDKDIDIDINCRSMLGQYSM